MRGYTGGLGAQYRSARAAYLCIYRQAPAYAIHRGGKFNFEFNITAGYPHDAPKVLCTTKVSSRAPRTPPWTWLPGVSQSQLCPYMGTRKARGNRPYMAGLAVAHIAYPALSLRMQP